MPILAGWRFCPRCRSDLAGGGSRVECQACGFVAYANSAPTANALCVDGRGRVLLARRAHEPDEGLWDVPGGFLEEGEHPLDGVRRELREEAGLEVEPLEFLCATVDRYGDGESALATLNLTWTARVVSGTPTPADDVSELRWFGRDELPPDRELAFATVAEVLSAWRRKQDA
ncbi:MAG: NUDIX domain-containing protein [Actinomycetota bacterium]|nr:NUDIX domain-containing protein [Actinomycetota bacterium]